jgi:hypothetical protein
MIISPEGFEEHVSELAQRRERLRKLGEWHLQEHSRLHSRQASNGGGESVVDYHLRASEAVRQLLADLQSPIVQHYEAGYSEYLRLRQRMLDRVRELREWHLQEARRLDPAPSSNRQGESSCRSMADFHERATETLDADVIDLQSSMDREHKKEQLRQRAERLDRFRELRDWHAQEARRRRVELAKQNSNRRNDKVAFHDRAAETLYDAAVDLALLIHPNCRHERRM